MRKGKLARATWFGTICCVLILMLCAQPAKAQDRSSIDYITGGYISGTIVGIGGRFAGRTRPFTLRIKGYTGSEEAQQLQTAYQSGGQDQLLNVMHKIEKGRLQVGNNVGIPVNVVLATATESGTRITVIYERTVRFYELRYGARSQDYRFGYMELYLKRDGSGEGTLIPAARIKVLENGTWEVENWGEFPARLLGVRVRR